MTKLPSALVDAVADAVSKVYIDGGHWDSHPAFDATNRAATVAVLRGISEHIRSFDLMQFHGPVGDALSEHDYGMWTAYSQLTNTLDLWADAAARADSSEATR